MHNARTHAGARERHTRAALLTDACVPLSLNFLADNKSWDTRAKDDENDEFFIYSMHSDIIGARRGSAAHSKAARFVEGGGRGGVNMSSS